MIQINERAGRPSLYIAHGLARACIEIELARTMSIRNRGTDSAVIDYLTAQNETSPEIRGSIDWSLTRTSPEDEGPLPQIQVSSEDHSPEDQGTQLSRPPLNPRAEEKILFLINELKEEENKEVSPSPSLSQPNETQKTNGGRKVPPYLADHFKAWDFAVKQIGADMALSTRQRYLDPLELVTVKIDLFSFVIRAPDQHVAEWAEARLAELLKNIMYGFLARRPHFEFQYPEPMEVSK
jgi:hypothetical protein